MTRLNVVREKFYTHHFFQSRVNSYPCINFNGDIFRISPRGHVHTHGRCTVTFVFSCSLN